MANQSQKKQKFIVIGKWKATSINYGSIQAMSVKESHVSVVVDIDAECVIGECIQKHIPAIDGSHYVHWRGPIVHHHWLWHSCYCGKIRFGLSLKVSKAFVRSMKTMYNSVLKWHIPELG